MDPTAVVGRRVGAILIDGLLIAVIAAVVYAVVGEPTDDNEALVYALVPYAGLMVLGWLFQGFTGGTPGKLFLGLRVIDRRTGELATYEQTWNRTVLWLIDGQFIGMVGLITSLCSKGHRRVGDMVAKTLVVDRSEVGRLPAVPGLTVPTVGAAAIQYGGDGVSAPKWDAERGAYIFWDPEQQRWLQFEDSTKEWTPI